MSRGVEGREILMGSEVGVDAPSDSGPLASGLEKEDVRFDEDEGIRELCPVGSYPRGGCGVDCKRIGLAGGVRE